VKSFVETRETIDRELGRKKFMLRIPQFRNELRNASGSKIDELFIAYQLAVSVHDRVLVELEAQRECIEDYVRIFRDIEEKIAEFFSRDRHPQRTMR
jgi:hypothetical protein